MLSTTLRSVMRKVRSNDPILWSSVPNVAPVAGSLGEKLIIYYATDDYSHWPGGNRQRIQDWEQDLLRKSHLVFAASEALCGACRTVQPRTYYLPHGVDVQHFGRVQDSKTGVADQIASLPGPRVGFFGLIYEKVDLALLARLAQALPDVSIVLIGPVATDIGVFAQLKNVYTLGQVRYEDLPAYLKGLDVLLLPYVRDEQILRSGPLKLRECLAAGKPIVSINLPDVLAYQDLIRVARDETEFINLVQRALQPDSSGSIALRMSRVSHDSWDSRAEAVMKIIASFAK